MTTNLSIAVRHQPVDTGRSGWEALSARDLRALPVRELDGAQQADWLIIGAGFAGLSAARRLTQLRPGEKVVVLDARELAQGPAGRNSGFMIDVPHNLSSGEYSTADANATAREIAENRYAIGFAAEVAAEYGLARSTFDPSGKINAAATPRGLQMNERYAQSLQRIGEPSRQLDAREMREITGSSYYLGGLHTPGAVIIQPAEYILALARGLAPQIEIRENSPVTQLSRQGGVWTARTPRGSVSAPKVILGVNGHVQDFGHFGGRLMHVFTYASMTAGFPAQAAGGAERWALLPADPMGATIRRITHRGQGHIVVRTRFTYDPSMQVSEQRVAAIAAEQQRSFIARFPELKHLCMVHSWAGRLCLSLNNVPAFGEIEPGLYSACCENGLGTVKSTLAGVMAADLATGTRSDRLTSFMTHEPPKRLLPEPLMWLGANAVIRWQELRAGREA